ncbi:MAG TPA: APC family permease [Gemmatimonadaceae bacterium]|jgi:glutamate:GABA antiporter|nr:APC family permease [Gemmatimonadaceae bacterium]
MTAGTERTATSASAERVREVEARTPELRKELGLPTLVLTQIMFIVGSGWVGTAAKLGTGHVVFWLAAMALYYLPQAAVVIYLNRLMPLEGGLYQWATVGFGEFGGFVTAWNLWAFAILILATFGVMMATNLSYLVGTGAAWLTGAAWYTPVVSGALIVFITLLAMFGLRVGKWMQSIGGAAQVLTYVALLIVPFVALARGQIKEFHPFAASMPPLTVLNLNLLGKMALGALSGFEYVAILAGECKNPARTIGRSVVIASPIIALMFILGTSTVVALVPKDQIDLVSPIPQTLTIVFRGMGVASMIAPLLIALLMLRQIGNVSLMFAGTTRLPMVAGWDGLLPKWFSRLHPRYLTPTNSILFVGALTLAFTLAGQVGVGLQEAFQVLENAGGIFYAFAYVAMFSIPLFAARRLAERPPLWLKGAALAGLGMSVLYSVLSIFPIIDVPDWRVFSAKIVTVLVVANMIGVFIFALGRRRAARVGVAVAD